MLLSNVAAIIQNLMIIVTQKHQDNVVDFVYDFQFEMVKTNKMD